MTTEGREVNPDQITHHVVHPALHQDYTSDFTEGYRHCSHPHIPHIGGDCQQYASPQEANDARRA